MAGKTGRPPKNSAGDTRQLLLDTAMNMLQKDSAGGISVRKICAAADLSAGTFYHHFRDRDDLLMQCIQGESFGNIRLKTGLSNITGRIVELHMLLVRRYEEQGTDFVKSVFSVENRSILESLCEQDGDFAEGTVMARCEKELETALDRGFIKNSTDVHTVSMDIGTIVKGCLFEWCLTDGDMDLEETVTRIISNYLALHLK